MASEILHFFLDFIDFKFFEFELLRQLSKHEMEFEGFQTFG